MLTSNWLLSNSKFSQNESYKILKIKAFEIIRKPFKWRWLSIFLLGISTNFVINLFLDFKYQRPPVSFSLEEYVNAIIGAYFLLEGLRFLNIKLDHVYPWHKGTKKRIAIQSSITFTYIIVMLNILLVVLN